MADEASDARLRRTARICPHCGAQEPTLGTSCPACGRPFDPRSLIDRIPFPDGDGAGAFALPALIAAVGWLVYAAILRPVILTVLVAGLVGAVVLGVGWQAVRGRLIARRRNVN
jgi:hypothetical protein